MEFLNGAYELLQEYNKSESLLRHGMTVAAVMEYFAREAGLDPVYWGTVGLLHDLDYEKWPDQHCKMTKQLLEDAGYEAPFIRAILCHGYGLCTDVEPESYMEKVLYTIDELTGLIAAAVYMRPSKSVLDLELKSVKKKWKDKSFAAGVNRDVVLDGCARLGLELDCVIEKTIAGMREHAAEIGLKGNL